MSQILTKEIAYKELQKFFEVSTNPFVLFGTGTSCAVDTGFGMGALKEHLFATIPRTPLEKDQEAQWEELAASLDGGTDLESAMGSVKDERLIGRIVSCTAELVASLDRQYGVKILAGQVDWPALPLLKRLVEGLPDNEPVLHVATSNYDLLAEYALEHAQLPYITGFCGQLCRRSNWEQAERGLMYVEKTAVPRSRRKPANKLKSPKHIRLYKVHGSLNTFKVNNAIIENNAWICEAPGEVERMMITPGTSKYERLHQNRYELLAQYDSATEKHRAFLFIGFGFNDNQLINDSIKHKLKGQKCAAVVITRGSNERIDSLSRECDNLWLICKHPDAGTEKTMIRNSRFSNELLVDEALWDSREFAGKILGG